MGSVADPTGLAVPDAQVRARREASGAIVETKTGAMGRFYLPSLVPGEYSISVEKDGFAKSMLTGIRLGAVDTVEVSLVLKLGEREETVIVTGSFRLHGRGADVTREQFGWYEPEEQNQNRQVALVAKLTW